MNGFEIQQGMGDAYGMDCPYRNSCPARDQCPYCPHRMEEMNTGYYGNMQMEYYANDNMYPVPCPYDDVASQELGYENLYPMPNEMAADISNKSYDNEPASPQYNQYGYLYPDENVLSPWANNAMYGGNINPLPMKKCPFQ